MNVVKSSQEWNYGNVGWCVGGVFPVNNQSGAYHGLLKQWWDCYRSPGGSWLLVSEKNTVKSYFEKEYTTDRFFTTEFYANDDEVDFRFDLCQRGATDDIPKFNMVICQATLEHVYDPFSSMLNMSNALKRNGVLLIHTHVPGYPYHPFPRDYLRYYPDWFIDIADKITLDLLELCFDDENIFVAYKRK